MKVSTCTFRVLGCSINVRFEDKLSFELIREGYSAFLTEPNPDSPFGLVCRISRSGNNDRWILQCENRQISCHSTADLIYDFEKTMTVCVQKHRTELFFTHAAALSIDNRCVVISGASGSGKSTLAWNLCHLGFDYLSDELAPIHPTHLHVEPYPHALCLKTRPLSGPPLPKSTMYTSATMHVPAYELNNHKLEQPCPIDALVFIDSCRNGGDLRMDAISKAEAAARLYSNGLNQLAHIGDGLPPAAHIAGRVPSVFVTGGTVEERCRAIRHFL